MEYDEQDEEEEDPGEMRSGYDHQKTPLGRKGGNSSSTGEGPWSRNPASRYRECLKNHAVGIGGHALDGCGEFMPAGEEGTLDALKCAACNCHRNFHRKDGGGGVGDQYHHLPHLAIPYYRGGYSLLHHVPQQHRSPPLALPSTSSGGEDHDDEQMMAMMGGGVWGSGSSSRKRFRTKFTQEQKDRMLEFSEKLGWRIQKHDEAAVQRFCEEVGVRRQVFKVWMHNNKHTLGRVPPNPAATLPPPPLPTSQQDEQPERSPAA